MKKIFLSLLSTLMLFTLVGCNSDVTLDLERISNELDALTTDEINIPGIYVEDMEKIKAIKGNSVYRIMPVLMKQIVFTKKEVIDESGVSVNVTSNIINQLVDLGIIVPDQTVVKKGYRYKRIYEVFVGNSEYR